MRWLLLFISALTLRAQLPVARLTTVFPPGAAIGAPVEVAVNGADLDDLKELRFSHAGITAAQKDGTHFTVTASSNVPPGIYEARVVGRFGASNPRAFVVGDRPEVLNAGTNKSFATAQTMAVGSAVNGKATANAPDFFKFKAAKGQRVIGECLGRQIDSRMEPILTLFDASEKEIAHVRGGTILDFTAPTDDDFVVRVNDAQFRGGDEYGYHFALRGGPWIDFARPAAIEAGAKASVTLFGRNLPGGKPSEFKVDGKILDQVEVEIEAPKEPSPSYLARKPAAAGVDGFEYRLASAEGASNPILLSIATAKVVLEAGANEKATNAMVVTVSCEIQGQFYPRNDVDWYQFDAAKGDVYWIEIFSQRLGLNTDPFMVVQRITKNDRGEETISDTQEIYDNDANAGGLMFNTASRDPAYRLEAKEAGAYRIQARDLFSETISDPRRIYRLSIHKEAPDFRLIAYAPAPPPLNKDSKEAQSSGAFLRRGDSTLIQLLALRKDGFGGDIEVTVEGLPKGVSAGTTKFVNGANSASLILEAAEDTAAWSGPLRIVGKARVGEKDLAHAARAGAILWNVADYQIEPIQSQLTHELFLTVSGAEVAPLAFREEKPVDAVSGAKVTVPLTIVRRGEFKGALKFTTLFEPKKEFEVAAGATNATFEIDLDKTKLPVGTNAVALYATSPGRYRRITADEAKATEDEIKKLKDSLAGITEAPKKDAVNNQVKALEARLQYKDLTATIYGAAPINVTAPPPKKAP